MERPQDRSSGAPDDDLADTLSCLEVQDLRPDREIGEDDDSGSQGSSGPLEAPADTKGGSRKVGGLQGVLSRLRRKGPRRVSLDSVLSEVVVDSLPQCFVSKYVGCEECAGLWGIQCVRGPMERLIQAVKGRGHDLPLMAIQVTPQGLQLSVHRQNKAPPPLPAPTLIPIEFISYAVQDVRYTRMFTFILVKEMSYKRRVTECHVYLCDSVITARKLALSISKAFQDYAKGLKGKPFRFQVDLRPTRELESELGYGGETQSVREEEC